MTTLTFEQDIHASPEKVWNALWEPENYKKWTAAFSEGSYYKTSSFTQDSRIQFLTPNGEGMYSIIELLDEPKRLVFNHIGSIKNFKELPVSDKEKDWTNSKESYELVPQGQYTKLVVKVDSAESFLDFMNKMFPQAIQKLKNLAEQ